MIAAVAAGHIATADAGFEVLEDGGTAADAAVAATLASCVAETLMTGLLGGGHAIVFDAASGRVRNLDCFVAVPSGRGAPMQELRVPFGEELIHYAIGASSCAVPGVPAGVDVWGHGGSYGGFQSSLLLVPSRGAVFAGLTNSGRGAQALREVEDVFFERVVGSRRAIPPTVELDGASLDAVAGSYSNSDLRATVAVDGPGLALELVELDRATGAPGEVVSTRARPIGPRTFECLDGDAARARFDFPLPGFARIGSRLAERVA